METRGTAGALFTVLHSRPRLFRELSRGLCILFLVFGVKTEMLVCICSHTSLSTGLGCNCLCVFLVLLPSDSLVSQEEPQSGLCWSFSSAGLETVLLHSLIFCIATSSLFSIQDAEDLASRTKPRGKVLNQLPVMLLVISRVAG